MIQLDPTIAAIATAVGLAAGKGIESGIRYTADKIRRRNGNGKRTEELVLEELRAIRELLEDDQEVAARATRGLHARFNEVEKIIEGARGEVQGAHKDIADNIQACRRQLSAIGAGTGD